MNNLFKVVQLNDEKKIGILKSEASSSVKSTKIFPIYFIDGKKMIYKPLSKTKPLTTPFFAYSEVYWSYIIQKYFDKDAPRYYLAKSNNIDDDNSKYYDKGVLVESLTKDNEELINLYDYFIENPDSLVDIKDYINYCMTNYDYTKILQSEFINCNKELGEGLAYQILLSVLRQDQNFHYENINFIKREGDLVLASPIDFEFSTPFLYPDNNKMYEYYQSSYFGCLSIEYEEDEMAKAIKIFSLKSGFDTKSKLTKNICFIVKNYPNVVLKFIKKLETLLLDLSDIKLSDSDNYIGNLNSEYWMVGHAFYKEKDMKKYEELNDKIKLKEINKDIIFERINADILFFAKWFHLLLKTYMFSFYKGISIDDLTMKQVIEMLNHSNLDIEELNLENNLVRKKDK